MHEFALYVGLIGEFIHKQLLKWQFYYIWGKRGACGVTRRRNFDQSVAVPLHINNI